MRGRPGLNIFTRICHSRVIYSIVRPKEFPVPSWDGANIVLAPRNPSITHYGQSTSCTRNMSYGARVFSPYPRVKDMRGPLGKCRGQCCCGNGEGMRRTTRSLAAGILKEAEDVFLRPRIRARRPPDVSPKLPNPSWLRRKGENQSRSRWPWRMPLKKASRPLLIKVRCSSTGGKVLSAAGLPSSTGIRSSHG